MKIKNIITTVLIATLMIAWIGIPGALAATPDQNYATYCAGCHGADRTGGFGPNITPAGLAALGITTSAQIDTILTTGVMQSEASSMSASDILALSQWLLPASTPTPTPTSTPAPTPTSTPTPTATPPATGVFDQNTNITFSHGNITAAQIAEIQPGLGTVMREYGYRLWVIYYAAKNDNWDLAQYELKEAREIQEVGETTRPGRATMLKAFESTYLDPLQNTMNAKDLNAFTTQYSNTVNGCNTCHVANNFSYIHFTLPSYPPNILFATTPSLVSSITPDSRNAQVGIPVTVFMTVINGGTATATNVSITQAPPLEPLTVSYQPWNGTAFMGSPNTPVDMNPGDIDHFVLSINATSAFTSSALTFNVSSTNGATAPISGVNTLTISASLVQVPGIIMVSTNPNVSTAVNTAISFAVATSNVGASATGVSLNVVVPASITGLAVQVNQTNQATGAIIGPATGLTINAGDQPTFAVFLKPTQKIAFDPANNRITLQLVDGTGKIIGAQSVAVSTT